MQRIRIILTRFTIPLIILASTWTFLNVRSGKNFWKQVIISDGKGYYSYLPAVFIYHDLNFHFFDTIEKEYYPAQFRYDYRVAKGNGMVDKYFAGVAVMQTPFFLLGHLAAEISGAPADGYSKPYVFLFFFGAMFWLWIGLYHLKKFLLMHGAKDGIASFLIAVIYFGTNLMYYSVFEPAMSHLYSFALVSMFLVHGKHWITKSDRRSFFIVALIFGMIILVRPVNGLIGLWLMIEAGGIRSLFRKKMNMLKDLKNYPAYLLFIIPLLIQLVIYHIQCGLFFIDAYGEEGFHFSSPHMIDFLFSYRKGLFVYVPLTFLALFGFIHWWKQDRSRCIQAILFLSGSVYILSCWWMWYYGGSFGPRVMVEYFPVFALLLFYLFRSVNTKLLRVSLTILALVIVAFCQFQTAQYRYGTIHWSEMNKEKYWGVFGKLKVDD